MQQIRPGRFDILPVIIKNIVIINVLVFLATETFKRTDAFDIEAWLALHSWQSSLFKPWQFITYLFMHGDLSHIFFNLFALWMFGSILENLWSPKRFLTFYLICGIGAGLCHMVVLYVSNQQYLESLYLLQQHFDVGHFINFYKEYHLDSVADIDNFVTQWQQNPSDISFLNEANHFVNTVTQTRLNTPTVGASGAVFGCLAAFAYLFPNSEIYIYFFLPIKAKWFVLGYAAVELYGAVKNSAGDNVAHVAHLGGALFGILLVYFWNKTNKQRFY